MTGFERSVAEKIFAKRNAIITGDHFVYAKKSDGWYHGYNYVNKDAIYPFVDSTKRLGDMIANHFKDKNVETVVGPTVGGAILSQWVASGLINFCDREVFAVFADEVDSQRIIKRGYDAYVKGKRCLIVEDVINSGVTVLKTRDAIYEAGGSLVGVGALCDRRGSEAWPLGVSELVSLVDLDMKMFKEEDCPICKEKGVESVRTDLGKGKEFLARIGKC